MTVFGGFITGGTVSTDPGDTTKLNFSGIVINGALGAVAGDTFSAGGYQVQIASIDGTGAATLVYAFPVALDDEADYAIVRDSAERYNPAATNLLVRQYLAKIADASITYVVPDGEAAPTELIAPDPQEGQKAIRFSNPWKTWLYTGGVWVEQPGAPGEQGSTILAQDTEPSTDYPTNSIWIDSDSADLDVYELIGIPLVWTDTGINLKGATGATAWLPPEDWATATEYTAGPPASLVVYGGESYACLEDHESDNFYTNLAAGKWFKVAAKGADGLGTGDVVGPSSSTDAHIVLFDGVTGKAIKDSGKAISDLATIPAGGATGQLLAKASGTDYDVEFIDGGGDVGAVGFHNRLINPSGQIWQRANSGAAAITDVTYVFDRWYGLTQSAGITASQITNAENGSPYMMRLSQANVTAQRFGIAQAVESANIIDARGQAVALSARVKMSAATTLRYAIVEWTGTADAITKDVVNDWTNGAFTAGNFFISTTTTITATGSVALAANTPTTINLTGTVSGSMNNLIVFFWTDSAQAQNVTLDVGKAQLEIGSSATPLAGRSITQELQLCQRYFEKTYPMGDAPGKVYGTASGGNPLCTYVFNSASYINIPAWQFKTTMRVAPTVTAYSPYTGNAGYARDGNGAQDVVVLATTNEQQTNIAMNGSPTVNYSNYLYAHATANAEL